MWMLVRMGVLGEKAETLLDVFLIHFLHFDQGEPMQASALLRFRQMLQAVIPICRTSICMEQ